MAVARIWMLYVYVAILYAHKDNQLTACSFSISHSFDTAKTLMRPVNHFSKPSRNQKRSSLTYRPAHRKSMQSSSDYRRRMSS